jgi:hypothetical protein
LIRAINRKWQPKLTAIKDKNGNMLQDKEDIKRRWTEYCSSLYCDTGDGKDKTAELERLWHPRQ